MLAQYIETSYFALKTVFIGNKLVAYSLLIRK